MANDGEYRMQATEHDITFLFSVGLCLRFGLRPKPRFSKEFRVRVLPKVLEQETGENEAVTSAVQWLRR